MGEGDEGLSVQELRAKRKAEKKALMAQKKKGNNQQQQQQQQQGGKGKEPQQKGGKGKGKEVKKEVKKEVVEEKKEEVKKDDKNTVSWFSDLQPYQESKIVGVQRQLHPKVVQLGLLYSQGKISGSTARCVALLRTLQYVIKDYKIPPNKGVRHLSTHLEPSINFLFSCRVPPPVSMTNAVTWLFRKISKADESLSEDAAKTHFCDMIDEYVETRIQRAHEVIIQSAVNKISDGDVVLTYSSSYIVEQVLLSAWRAGKKFEVFVLDSSPSYHGKTLLHKLQENGVKCSYALLTAATFVIKNVSKVFLGVSCLMSNGNAMARAGTSMVAMAAKSFGVPVLVCCESIKFTEKVWLDSIGQNELGNPDLILADVTEKLTAMGGNFEETKKNLIEKNKEDDVGLGMNKSPKGLVDGAALLDWKKRENLKLLNLVYDVTPVGFIDVVVSDVGMMPPSSVAVVVRELTAEL